MEWAAVVGNGLWGQSQRPVGEGWFHWGPSRGKPRGPSVPSGSLDAEKEISKVSAWVSDAQKYVTLCGARVSCLQALAIRT
jgi:hypothetical protein